jgi:hypothetical protein
LTEFAAERSWLHFDNQKNEVFLYHGTNCYRRWEIKRTGAVEPGRSQYSFFSDRPEDAFRYARSACLRDISPGAVNSLTCEPVVLKLKFNSRTWLQVDFVQTEFGNDELPHLTMAVLGPIAASAVIDVLHCTHGRRLGFGAESIRSFQDGTLLLNIRQLRTNSTKKRVDIWVLHRLGNLTRAVNVSISGGQMPEQTFEDGLRRLKQVRA